MTESFVSTEGLDFAAVEEAIETAKTPAELEAIIAALEAEVAWRPWAHQIAPDAELGWALWLLLAGRGSGKTDACANYVDEHVAGPPCLPSLPGGHRIGIIAPTLGDAVDACVEGPSGLKAHNPEVRLVQRPGGLIVEWPSGAIGKLFGAHSGEDVERLRAGGNRCLSWLEEFAAWVKLPDAWKQMTLGTRLGPNPHAVASTTPKPRALIKLLVGRAREWADERGATVDVGESSTDLSDEQRAALAEKTEAHVDVVTRRRWQKVIVTRARTRDNPGLDPEVRAGLEDEYAGTRLGRQELEGEIVDDFEGALWDREKIDLDRVIQAPALARILIGVDPSTWGLDVSNRVDLDDEGEGIETGIVAAGVSAVPLPYTLDDGTSRTGLHVYILGDWSQRASPHIWAKKCVEVYRTLPANAIVPEINAGNAFVTSTLRGAVADGEEPVSIDPVRAKTAKRVRAEPVAALYEQHRVHHVGTLPVLEDQMCSWDPKLPWSPDRIDALVYAVTKLAPWQRSKVSTSTAADREI